MGVCIANLPSVPLSPHSRPPVAPQVRILEEAGQLPLAYVAAATHGLHEDAERIGQGLPELPDMPEGSRLLQPPTPILKVLFGARAAAAWPLPSGPFSGFGGDLGACRRHTH